MINGHLKIKNFFLVTFILILSNGVNSNEIEIAPLINLDEIAPSYDQEDESKDNHEILDKKNNFSKKKMQDLKIASIGVLNKITAKVSTIDINLGKDVFIFDLQIFNKACHISSPEEKPLVAVYLIIDDLKDNNIFSGWMVKDLPSVSAMEHPLYDIWVIDCV